MPGLPERALRGECKGFFRRCQLVLLARYGWRSLELGRQSEAFASDYPS